MSESMTNAMESFKEVRRENMNRLELIAEEVHENAVQKGFWEKENPDEQMLMLVITELSEAVEADRKGRRTDLILYEKDANSIGRFSATLFKYSIKDTVEDELADAFIRLLDLSASKNLPISIYQREIDYFKVFFQESNFPQAIYYLCKDLTDSHKYESLSGKINYCLSKIYAISESMNFDIDLHVKLKMKYNKTREAMHGKKY